jgi:lipoprotein-releasing system permease protein
LRSGAAGMKRLDWYIARRYLAARKKGRFLSFITWIALGGVTVGVSALVVVIAVMTGMQKDLKAKILGSTPHIMVLEFGSALRMADWQSVLETVRGDPEVVAAQPFILSEVALMRAGVEYTQPANLYGVPTDTTGASVTDMEDEIRQGIYDLSTPPSGLPAMIMGSGLAQQLQVFEGDTLVVVGLENFQMSALGAAPVMRQFEVTGTFTTGMWEYDSKNVYTTIEQAQRLLGLDARDIVSGIGVRTTDFDRADQIGARLQETLAGANYHVTNWMDTNRSLFAALKLEKLGMGLILFLIVLVAAFNIVSTLIMVVADRTREIGILKSMGMTDSGILRVFIFQGAWIGVMGTALGTALGTFLCYALERWELIEIDPQVYFVDRLPVSLEIPDLLVIIASTVLIAFLATIYPSLQASRLQPVEAIRHD